MTVDDLVAVLDARYGIGRWDIHRSTNDHTWCIEMKQQPYTTWAPSLTEALTKAAETTT